MEDKSFDNFYYKEVANLTGAGGWSVDFLNKKSYLDPAAREILNVPGDFHPSLLGSLLDFYVEGEHREKAVNTFMKCAQGTPFDTSILMQTYQGDQFWVRAIGRPKYNKKNEIIGVHGVFVDVNEEKIKELDLETSLKTIEKQNEKLRNFAHIISHNLRSHTSNLHLTLELLNLTYPSKAEGEEKYLRDTLVQISNNLNNTLTRLNEIISVKNIDKEDLQKTIFDEVFTRVKQSISNLIIDNEVEIFQDFSEIPEINYVESYLESILLNLLTNAIKYKHPDRSPSIQIHSFYRENKPCLLIKDNGLGIDLEKYGHKLFEIYQTFHNNDNAQGVGLYLTKTQVEALGGRIEVESELNKFTTFIIEF